MMPMQTPIPGYVIYSREMSVDDAEIHLFGICRPWISFIRTWTGHYQVLDGRANQPFLPDLLTRFARCGNHSSKNVDEQG